MSRRQLFGDAQRYVPKLVEVLMSWQTNAGSNPDVTLFIPKTSNGVTSITRVTTGEYLVTLSDPMHKLVNAFVELEDSSTGDGRYGTKGPMSGVGTGTITFKVWTNAANGTKTDFASSRVSMRLEFKDGLVND